MAKVILLTLLVAGCGSPSGATDSERAKSYTEAQRATEEATKPQAAVALSAQERWQFQDEPMNWYDAVANAPEGCRLPARWEVIKAFDGGEFEEVNTTVWTATDIDEWDAYYIILSNMPGYNVSRSDLIDKRNSEFVAYICGEKS